MIVSDHWQSVAAAPKPGLLCWWRPQRLRSCGCTRAWVYRKRMLQDGVYPCVEVVFKTLSSLSGRLFFVQWQEARQDGL